MASTIPPHYLLSGSAWKFRVDRRSVTGLVYLATRFLSVCAFSLIRGSQSWKRSWPGPAMRHTEAGLSWLGRFFQHASDAASLALHRIVRVTRSRDLGGSADTPPGYLDRSYSNSPELAMFSRSLLWSRSSSSPLTRLPPWLPLEGDCGRRARCRSASIRPSGLTGTKE